LSFSDLKARVVAGTYLVAGAQLLRQLIQLGAVALLARLVVPADFGLVALAVGVLVFAQVLADFGLGAALERENDLEPGVESRLFRLNLLSAVLIAALAMVAAPFVARLLGQPDLTFLLRTLALPFLTAGAFRTRTSALARQMRFGRLAVVEMVPVVVGTAVSVSLAYRGWGVMALVAGSGVQQVVWSGAAVLAAGLPSAPPAPLRQVLPLIRFGGSLSLFQILNAAARKLDDLLVGGFMGVAALGIYEKSYALMMIPVAYLAGAANRVLYPALSRVREEPAQFRFLYLGAMRKMAGLSFPASAFCAAAAGPVVHFVLGPRFDAAAPLFALFALMLGIQPLLSVSGVVYLAHARMRLFLAVSSVSMAVVIGSFFLGVRGGSPDAMARWYVGAYALIFLPSIHFILRTAGVRWGEFLGRVAPPALSAVAMFAVGLATRRFAFGVQACSMVATYLGVHLVLDREALLDMFRFLDPRRVVVRVEVPEDDFASAAEPAVGVETRR